MRFLPVALALLATLGACAAPADEDVSADESDLTLASTDIVGTLDGVTTREAAVPAGTKYRAFSFTAAAGTRVGISVSSRDGVPTALLLGPTFKTLAKKKATSAIEEPNRPEAMVTMTFDVPAAGTYYVAFRDLGGAAARFQATRIGTIPSTPTCTKDAECTGTKNTCALGRCVQLRSSTMYSGVAAMSLGYEGAGLSIATLTQDPVPAHGSYPHSWTVQSGPLDSTTRPKVARLDQRSNGSGYLPTPFGFQQSANGVAVLATTATNFHTTTLLFGSKLAATPPTTSTLQVAGDELAAFDAMRRPDGSDLAVMYSCNPTGSSQPAQCVLYLAERTAEQAPWTVETVTRSDGGASLGSVLVHPRADGQVEILASSPWGIEAFVRGAAGWNSFQIYGQSGFRADVRLSHGVDGRSHAAVGETRLDDLSNVLRFESHYLEIGDDGQIVRRFPLVSADGYQTQYGAPRADAHGNVYLLEGQPATALVRIDGAGAFTRRTLDLAPTATLRSTSLAVGPDGAVSFGAVHSIQGGTYFELAVQRLEP